MHKLLLFTVALLCGATVALAAPDTPPVHGAQFLPTPQGALLLQAESEAGDEGEIDVFPGQDYITYDDGNKTQNWYWPYNNQYALVNRFTPQAYPVELVSCRSIVNYYNGRNIYLRVYDDNGSGGKPGTQLYTQQRLDIPPFHNPNFKNYDLTAPLTFPNGDFYMGWYQAAAANMVIGGDGYNHNHRDWRKSGSGSWGLANMLSDMMIRASVYYHDVGATGIAIPTNGGTYVPGASITPRGLISNYASNLAEGTPFNVDFKIRNASGTQMYTNTKTITLTAGQSNKTLNFNAVTMSWPPGTYTAVCSTRLALDCRNFNNRYQHTFILLAPPPAPTPQLPPNGSNVATLTPLLQVASISGCDQYEFKVYLGGGGLVASGISPGNTWTVSPALTNGQTYEWECRAHNAAGWGLYFSPRWTFNVKILPGAPVPTAPPNGSNVATLTPNLTVTAISGCDDYQFQVYTYPGHVYVTGGNSGSPTPSWTVSPALTNGQSYEWECRAHNAGGWGPYFSPRWSFAVMVGTEGLWTGNVSTDWNDPSNWDVPMVPGSGDDVLIPDGCPSYPNTNTGAGYDCASLEIEAASEMTVVSGLTLDCGGDIDNFGTLTNNGTIECAEDFANDGDFVSGSSSTLCFDGTASTICNSGVDAACSFFHVIIAKTGAADVETNGDMDIDGDLTINPGNTLINGGESFVDGHYYVAGDWTNNGTYDEGDGDITFDGVTAITGTGTHTFNSVTITGELTAPDEMTVNGDWTCSGTFNHNDGIVYFNGDNLTSNGASGAFYELEVENTADGPVTVSGNMAVEDILTITDGDFLLGENTLTMGTGSGSGTVTVDGGTFSVVGTALDARGAVTAADAAFPYAFDLASGTSIAAQYANFTWMDAGGIYVQDGATIDATDNFSHCTFTAGDDVGTMLAIEGSQVIDDIVWCDFYGSDGYNIDYTGGTGHITVTDGLGARWGEDYDDDPDDLVDWVVSTIHDVGVTAILRPAGGVGENTVVFPQVRVFNPGEAVETFDVRVIIDNLAPGFGEVFNFTEEVVALGIGETRDFEFLANSWTATPQQTFHVRCTTELAGDANPGNDMQEQDFDVGPPWPPGWHEVAPMPLLPSSKPVKRGAWLAFNEANGLVYAAKGYKTTEFFRYDPIGDSWNELTGMPYQTHTNPKWARKVPRKGSKGVCDGDHYIYVTQGNNTLGFWRYDLAGDSWSELNDVPLGPYRKKVKGGTDLAYVPGESDDDDYVYLLKGYKTEFYRFNVATSKWDTLQEAPVGARKKWDKGSWLVFNEADGTDDPKLLYAHKAKYHDGTYHELWKYDIPGDSWSDNKLKGMPLWGLHSGRLKKKKSKDGGSGAWYQGFIYALKGGNTQQFFKYTVVKDSWTELDTVPNYTVTTGRKRRVKYGADIVSHGSGAFFALKGNKTRELWRYMIPFTFAQQPARSGVMAGRVETARYKVTIAPNPLAGGFATLRYTLPMAGPAQISVFDVAGRVQSRRTMLASRSGAVSLDLRKLSAGVYLVRFDTDGFSTTRKLVVQH